MERFERNNEILFCILSTCEICLIGILTGCGSVQQEVQYRLSRSFGSLVKLLFAWSGVTAGRSSICKYGYMQIL